MFITRKRANSLPPPPLHLGGTVLGRVSSYKYLGVTLTSDLSWSTHISNSCNKTRRLIGLLYRRFYQCTNPPSLLRVYEFHQTPLRPLLGILITRARLTHLKVCKIMRSRRPGWGAWLPNESDWRSLAAVASLGDALRICLKSWDSNYAELLAAADLPSLQKRCIQLSLCHLYKIVNSLTDFPAASDHFHKTILSIIDKPAFIVPNFRASAYQYSFFPNTLSLWNDLPKDIFMHCSFMSGLIRELRWIP